jgi:hypothetical protein
VPRMVDEGTDSANAPPPSAARMYCYRHPDRETWVRCGRCDRPVCSACSMQGPVGIRCRTCGTPARDPLTRLRPREAVAGVGIALGGGIIGGLLAPFIGPLGAVCFGFLVGLGIGSAVARATAFKRGWRIGLIVCGGILIGIPLGLGLQFTLLTGNVLAGFLIALTLLTPPYLVATSGAPIIFFVVTSIAALRRLR